MNNKTSIPPPKSWSRSFTLIELIIVIIIVGILAAVGISQYSLIVEKGRTAEAKTRIGVMRQLAYEYYMNNGTLTTITNTDLGVDNTCSPTNFYRYTYGSPNETWLYLNASRCTSGGKTPNSSRLYIYYLEFYPGTGQSAWHCHYQDGDFETCYGLPY